MYMVLSENPLTDSIWAFKKLDSKSSSDLETRIPFPPPPLDALIITGKVIERKSVDGIRLPDEILYTPQSKQEYLANLKRVFDRDRNNLIRVSFDEIEIMRHPNASDPEYARVYGVTLHQGYRSASYSDDGYVFLLWDFTNENQPKILVRTWQPDAFSKDGKTKTKIPRDEIFSIYDFDDFKEQ